MAYTGGKWIVAALIAALACGTALAQASGSATAVGPVMTLYKLIDRNGKVEVIEVDMGANTATMPKFVPPARSTVAKRQAQANKVDELKERLAQLQAERDEAINRPGDEDIQRIGIVGGRTRPVPTEEYLKRLADLEAKIKATEDELSVERRK